MIYTKDLDIIFVEHVFNQKYIQKKDSSLVKQPKALASINHKTSPQYLKLNNHEFRLE
jgi:hypothetical protein